MAYPTSDGGEYKLAALCGWKEVLEELLDSPEAPRRLEGPCAPRGVPCQHHHYRT